MQKSTHTSEYKTLVAELRRMRKAAHLSQRDVAARLDAVPSVVANMETGERRIDLIEFIWFARACDADPMQSLKNLFDKIGKTTPRRRKR